MIVVCVLFAMVHLIYSTCGCIICCSILFKAHSCLKIEVGVGRQASIARNMWWGAKHRTARICLQCFQKKTTFSDHSLKPWNSTMFCAKLDMARVAVLVVQIAERPCLVGWSALLMGQTFGSQNERKTLSHYTLTVGICSLYMFTFHFLVGSLPQLWLVALPRDTSSLSSTALPLLPKLRTINLPCWAELQFMIEKCQCQASQVGQCIIQTSRQATGHFWAQGSWPTAI